MFQPEQTLSRTPMKSSEPIEIPATTPKIPPRSIEKVSAKLPCFWDDSPAAWFAAAEAEFEIAGITQERTRYSYLVSTLPKEILRKVMDLITKPAEDLPYTTLKKQLIERLTISEEQRLSQLLYHVEIGDRSPSDFYRYMVQLAGNSENLSLELVRKLWLARLPKTIEVSLIAIDTRDVNELLRIADRLWEVTQSGSIFSVNRNDHKQQQLNSPSENELLRKEIGELREMVKNLSLASQNNTRGRQRSRNRGQGGSRSRTPSNARKYEHCWYHFRYGAAANNCIPPCKFKDNQLASQNPSTSKN